MTPFQSALAAALHRLGVHPRKAVEISMEHGGDLLIRGYTAHRAALRIVHALEFWN